MEIKHDKQFKKNLKLRILPNPKLYNKFKTRVKLFILDPADPILKDHQLTRDKENYRAFSISSDIRVVYYQGNNYIYFIDIGTHEQVY